MNCCPGCGPPKHPDPSSADRDGTEAPLTKGRYRGPLHGIPIGLKDIYDTAGVPTEGGSRLCLGRIPAEDATTTRLLKEAGAIILGKLTTWEFAIGGTAFDTPFLPARNPWNIEYDPAGSSSGSGSAVAAGLCVAEWAAIPAAQFAGRRLGAASPG